MEVEMNKNRVIPLIFTVLITGVGLLFLVAVVFDLPRLGVKSLGSYVLSAVSLFFILFGFTYGYLLATGRLEKEGRTIVEVRQEAVKKMRDQTLLARLATGDTDPVVREAAQERLQELRT
jgi:hypothetical protein